MTLFETTFTLVFEGLMLFYGPSETRKSYVAIVNAPQTHHKPYVLFIDKTANEERKVALEKGDQITFDLTDGPADTDPKFDKYVVSIKDYLRIGDIADDVIEESTSANGVLSVVALPKGDLTILRTFPDRVRLRKWFDSDRRCFPRYVLLGAATDKDVEITITKKASPYTYTIDKNRYVLISNGAQPEDPYESHFHEYGRLLSRFGSLASAEILKNGCHEADANKIPPWLNQYVLDFLNGHEIQIPNGDCSVVDYP